MTKIELEKAKFAFLQYFDLTQLLNNAVAVLNCACLRWTTTDKFSRSFNYYQSLFGIIEVEERVGLMVFTFVISVHHGEPPNYSLSLFSAHLPCPVHRFNVNLF